MIPTQAPSLMDLIANCLVDAEHYFGDLQEKTKAPGAKCSTGGAPTAPTARNTFTLTFDLLHHDPSGISVKLEANQLTVEAKTEKGTSSEGEYEYRHFLKKVPIPENVLSSQLKCTMNSNGQLTVEAPLKTAEQPPNERIIPVQFVAKKTVQEEEKKQSEAEIEPEKSAEIPQITVEDIGVE